MKTTMSAYSTEFYRGVQAAFEALQAGHSKTSYLNAIDADTKVSGPDDFNRGARAQCLAWPEVLPLPEPEPQETDGSVLQGIFAGIACTTFLAFVVAYPKLSGPVAGLMFIIAVLSGLAAYRLRK
jgi:hypothetical protein